MPFLPQEDVDNLLAFTRALATGRLELAEIGERSHGKVKS
jgi:hypothetical protein